MRIASLLVIACTIGGRAAVAQPSATPPSPPPSAYTDRYERYGGTIALVDGLSIGAGVAGFYLLGAGFSEAGEDSEDAGNGGGGKILLGAGLILGSAGGLLFGGPIVHSRHHNSSGALRSFGARTLLPIGGALLGSALDHDDEGGAGAALFSAGLVAAMILDWTVLAKREVGFTPYASTGRDGTVVGLGGRF